MVGLILIVGASVQATLPFDEETYSMRRTEIGGGDKKRISHFENVFDIFFLSPFGCLCFAARDEHFVI